MFFECNISPTTERREAGEMEKEMLGKKAEKKR
jgi:hypothetical protein